MAMSDREIVVSLWDSLDVSTYGPVRDMHVYPVPLRDVDEFCKRWHYTATKGSSLQAYGLYEGLTLVGVATYNLPTMETCSSLFGQERWRWVLHLARLVCAEDAPRNVESRLIGESLRLLRADRGTRAVVTYADSTVGHVGYVYQATNALYTGTGGDTTYYVGPDGRRHSTFVHNRGPGGVRGDPVAMGWVKHRGKPKHRYVYLLGNKTERKEARRLLRLPVLAYPKMGQP